MFDKPTSRAENLDVTYKFTSRLAEVCKTTFGTEDVTVIESGNAGPDDDAFIVELEVDGLAFNIEVFGPYWEER